MGTDIYGVFQRRDKNTGKWHDITSNYKQDRHYQLFAVLAGVRNGYGFAGVPTGEPVAIISDPKGYPKDFPVDDESYSQWIGYHSHSWLSGQEMLAWFEKAPTVLKTGILDRGTYDRWDGDSVPDSYSRGIFGGGILIIKNNEADKRENPNWTHIQCTWTSSLRDELGYFFEEVARLVVEHGEVRFVFWFDS
jgi:hypothetical protein